MRIRTARAPWKSEYHFMGRTKRLDVLDAEGFRVCSVALSMGQAHAEKVARLIAQAPALLVVAQAFMDYINEHGTSLSPAAEAKLSEQARTAILSAKGA